MNDLNPLLVPDESDTDSVEKIPDVVVVSDDKKYIALESDASLKGLINEMTLRKALIFTTAAVVNFAINCCFSMMAPFLPLEADTKEIDSTMVGIIFSSFQLANFFGCIIFGHFLTAIGARFLYNAGLLVAASCAILFGMLQWCPPGPLFEIIAVSCRVVEAIGNSALSTASMAIVANEFPTRVATVIGVLESISGLGMMVGPTIGGALYDAGGFYLPFVVMGGIVFVVGLMAVCLMPKPAIVVPKDRVELLKKFLKVPAVCVCGFGVIVCSALFTFLDPILSNHLVTLDSVFADSQTLIGLVFLVMPGLYGILSPVVGYLADTFKHQLPLLALGNIGLMASFLLIGPSPMLPIEPEQLWITIVSLVVMGISVALCFIPAFSVINRACAKAGLPNDLDLYGLMAGLFGFTFNFGAFIGPLLGGILEQHFGFQWATSLVAFVPVIDLITIVFLAMQS